jgi:hypothetical protein
MRKKIYAHGSHLVRFSDLSNPDLKYVMTFSEIKKYRALLKYYNGHTNLILESNACISARRLKTLHKLFFAEIIGVDSNENFEIPIHRVKIEQFNLF